ncbi:type II secretion system F family protein [Streptobacillus moniliformis]|uniref:type II secretion system F family protein n=1 Tax=Streptobacillus moniliformis TaxID=34105 RepID=UPI0007EED6B2|nr:type II secretion system F family protein [Streptobacillus moniliformis]
MNKAKFRKEIVSRLEILLRSEIDIIDSVNVLCNIYVGNEKEKLIKLKKDLEKGKTLRESFKNINNNKEFLSYISIVEKTGNIQQVFNILKEKYEFEDNILKEVMNIISYPAILLFISFIILIAMMLTIVPKFVEIYNDLNAELPLFTKILISISEKLIKYNILIIFIFFALLVLFKYLIKINRYIIDKFKFNIKIYRDIFLMRYIQGIYVQLKSGIDFYDAVKNLNIVENEYFIFEMDKIIKKISKGTPLKKIYVNKKIFDNEFIAIINIAEKTGDLSNSFENLYLIYSNKVRVKIKMILRLLEPISIIVIALLIGSVLISLMLPLLNIGEMIN